MFIDLHIYIDLYVTHLIDGGRHGLGQNVIDER